MLQFVQTMNMLTMACCSLRPIIVGAIAIGDIAIAIGVIAIPIPPCTECAVHFGYSITHDSQGVSRCAQSATPARREVAYHGLLQLAAHHRGSHCHWRHRHSHSSLRNSDTLK